MANITSKTHIHHLLDSLVLQLNRVNFNCWCFWRYSTISNYKTDDIDFFFVLFFQINARTELALRYNDISPLENHHCAVAFEILEKVLQARLSTSLFELDDHEEKKHFSAFQTESNIFRNLAVDQYKRIREGIIKWDLPPVWWFALPCRLKVTTVHRLLMPAGAFWPRTWRGTTRSWTNSNPSCQLSTLTTRSTGTWWETNRIWVETRFVEELVKHGRLLVFSQLMMILIKVSDISNEARPMEVAEPWLDCLLQEFYNQVSRSLVQFCFIGNVEKLMQIIQKWISVPWLQVKCYSALHNVL